MSRKQRKVHKRWVIEAGEVEEWLQKASELLRGLGHAVETEVKNGLSAFHDIQATVSALIRGAEEVVRRQPGQSFEDQLESLSEEVRGLIQGIFLLKARLQLMPLVANPDSATYGDRHRTPVYRVFDRVIRMLRPLGTKRGVSVRLGGSSFNQPDGFNSFEVIPLVLVENAIKYSMRDQIVDVVVNDKANGPGVEAEVSSYSPEVSSDESRIVFEKGVRGSNSPTVASSGSGLGLYLAQIVARAHGFEIWHKCSGNVTLRNGIPYCTNTFSFTIS